MKRASGIAALIGGLLLVLVPRYLLPVCEYAGFEAMHCSDTALAEMLVGSLLLGAGAILVLVRRAGAEMAAVLVVLMLAASAMFLPEVFGYCRSPKMPCNYGTVPAIRIIAAVTAGIALAAAVGTFIQMRRRGRKS